MRPLCFFLLGVWDVFPAARHLFTRHYQIITHCGSYTEHLTHIWSTDVIHLKAGPEGNPLCPTPRNRGWKSIGHFASARTLSSEGWVNRSALASLTRPGSVPSQTRRDLASWWAVARVLAKGSRRNLEIVECSTGPSESANEDEQELSELADLILVLTSTNHK